MTISARKIKQLIERSEAGQIEDGDIDTFLENPRCWREPVTDWIQFTPDMTQAFWQGVYDELSLTVEVPPVPKLRGRQLQSLDQFGFMLAYVPAISEESYPACFVKPEWERPSPYFKVGDFERKPLEGQWVAVETIEKLNARDDMTGPYQMDHPDRLMAAVGRRTRFSTSYDDLMKGLLAKIAKVTGFSMNGTRLPTIEEWNLIANLFNWLRKHRNMSSLPDLGSTSSMELCHNSCGPEHRLMIGDSKEGGLAALDRGQHDSRYDWRVFRVLAVL